jgi:DNA polymerase-1
VKSAKSPPSYQLVTDAAELSPVLQAIDESERVGLDTETTGLDPRKDRVRLLTLATERGVFIVDAFAVDPVLLWPALAGKELIGHNLAFDLSFLWRMGFRPCKVFDTLLMSRLLTAGTKESNKLADVAGRHLGIEMSKELQTADWSGALSAEQLAYAAMDARVTFDLYEPLASTNKDAGLERVAEIENRAVPAFVWLACSGAPFDAQAWEALAVEAAANVAALEEKLNATAPPKPPPDAAVKNRSSKADPKWNWRSWQQVKATFALLGIDLPSTGDEVLATVNHPLAVLLREHRRAAQLVKAFGRKWLTFAEDGRIYARWNSLGTDAGRSSCKAPNLQQVPKDVRYRRCFCAPPGRVVVKADYGQLQLRIAAKLADEEKMLQAFHDGADLHTLTAQNLTGKSDVTKQDRQLAKVINFGMLFGMQAKALRAYARQEYGVELSEKAAAAHRRTFLDTYPGLAHWHAEAARLQWRARIGRATEREQESRTVWGRRRLFDATTPLTFRLNSPIQGSEADGAKLAMAFLWERREQCADVFPILFVHDEIVVECDEDKADQAEAWLRAAMIEAMQLLIDPVPCEVEVKTARTWGGWAT